MEHNLKSWIYNKKHLVIHTERSEISPENVCFTFDILKPFYGRFDNKLRILLCFD